jgi:hypothetical protein
MFSPDWRNAMAEPLPILMENSIQIAWNDLERTGEFGDPEIASRFLVDTVEWMVRRGERRRLVLSNSAIDAYKRFNSDTWRWSRKRREGAIGPQIVYFLGAIVLLVL